MSIKESLNVVDIDIENFKRIRKYVQDHKRVEDKDIEFIERALDAKIARLHRKRKKIRKRLKKYGDSSKF